MVFVQISHQTLGLATSCRLYVHGRVDYDPATGIIRYTDIAYDPVFSRHSVQALHWVISPYIRHRLEQSLTYPVNRELSKAHTAINQWIETLVITMHGPGKGSLFAGVHPIVSGGNRKDFLRG